MGLAARMSRAGVLAIGLGIASIGAGGAVASAAPDSSDGTATAASSQSEAAGAVRPSPARRTARRSDAPGRLPAPATKRAAAIPSAARARATSSAGSAAAARLPAVIPERAPAADARRAAGLLATVSALFNNQTPRLAPVQTGQSATGVVSGQLNAVDPDSERLTFTVADQPAHGTAAVSADGRWTYTPVPAVAANGITDSFAVTVSDAPSGFAIHGLAGLLHLLSFGLLGDRGDSSTATVKVVVTPFAAANNPPTGSFTLHGTDPATGSVTGSVIGNDPDGDTVSYRVTSGPGKGAVTQSAAGGFSYTPTAAARQAAAAPNATAADLSDNFVVAVEDGRGASTPVAVSVGIAPADEQPVSDYRQEMRSFVIAIAGQARSVNPGFIVIPQNGQELLTLNGAADGPLAAEYAAAIDGQGREDLFYGYNADNVATPAADRDYLLEFLDRDEAEGVQVLVTDYCSTAAYVDNSYARNAAHDFISFAADHRELDSIPRGPAQPAGVNADDVETLGQARNFLYLLNPGAFASRQSYLGTLAATDYDVVIIDAFYEGQALSPAEVAALQTKANGGRRLVIAYMSIGEAEDYRYYWQPDWRIGSPSWLDAENPDFAGNYKVRYWEKAWQDIFLKGPDAYLNRITAAGFDGVYLDLIDAFEFYE